MTQTFQLPGGAGNDSLTAATSVLIPACLESLRSSFLGASAPSSPTPTPGQLWADTADGYLKMRNAAGSAWLRMAPLSAGLSLQLHNGSWNDLTLSSTKTAQVGSASRACRVKRLVLMATNASTSSSGNEWRFQLKAYPNATPGSPVDLFSGNVGTFTALSGVGGGAEFVANVGYVLTPNQNATLTDLDRLELVATKLGTGTTLNNFHAVVEVE
jgi:hypothetical protein